MFACIISSYCISFQIIQTLISTLLKGYRLDHKLIPVFPIRIHISISVAPEMLRHSVDNPYTLTDVISIFADVVQYIDAREITSSF